MTGEKLYGYAGKILRVDLTNSTTEIIDSRNYLPEWIGGRALAHRIFWDEVKPGVGAFDPENKLIFTDGPAGGTGIPTGGRAVMCGIGANNLPEQYTSSSIGGWVGTVMDHQAVDVAAMMAGIVGAEPGKYNYFAEMETAGKCFEWVKDHLVLDEVNVYLAKTNVAESRETVYESLYDYMSDTVAKVAPGSGGVLFTPWLHGNRCPFEDAAAAGMFFNLRLETGKAQMLRAVLEGICFHLRWMLEVQEKKTKTSEPIRFVGGGALSPVTCQMLADITGRTIETVENTKDVGAIGAAMLAAVGSGAFTSLSDAAKLVAVNGTYRPDPSTKAVYDRNFRVFRKLYAANKENFAILNRLEG